MKMIEDRKLFICIMIFKVQRKIRNKEKWSGKHSKRKGINIIWYLTGIFNRKFYLNNWGSHAVLRNNTDKSCVHTFLQCTSMYADIDKSNNLIQISPVLLVLICVYVQFIARVASPIHKHAPSSCLATPPLASSNLFSNF